jgi:glycosyltransferase involved in cell wall biosynthesis
VMTSQEHSTPEISVIVPFHNSEEYIERCVEALIAQNYSAAGYEILMVDNNSADRSAEIVQRYPQARLLQERKPGAYAARNHGVSVSRGRILAFTDSDCVPTADWLTELMALFSDSTVGLVQGRRVFGDEASILAMLAAYEAETHAYIFSGAVKGAVFGYTNNMAVRREIFERCGPFLETARGADSIFVDRVVGAYSHQILRYARAAYIRHLEIDSVQYWLGKKTLYGRSFQRHRKERRQHRALTPAERSAIFRRTRERAGYSPAQAARLFAVILIGNLSFAYGRLTRSRIAKDSET